MIEVGVLALQGDYALHQTMLERVGCRSRRVRKASGVNVHAIGSSAIVVLPFRSCDSINSRFVIGGSLCGLNCLRMTDAVDGHAWVNWTELRTAAGTPAPWGFPA